MMLLIHLKEVRCNYRSILTYGPMFERDRERMENLKYMHDNNNVEAINILRMKRAPLTTL
jgi:hypothetical protein